jgi:hypothetical protein
MMDRRSFLKLSLGSVVYHLIPKVVKSLFPEKKYLHGKTHKFVLGIDTATPGHDYTAISVLRDDGENVFTLVDSCVSSSEEEIRKYLQSLERRFDIRVKWVNRLGNCPCTMYFDGMTLGEMPTSHFIGCNPRSGDDETVIWYYGEGSGNWPERSEP